MNCRNIRRRDFQPWDEEFGLIVASVFNKDDEDRIANEIMDEFPAQAIENLYEGNIEAEVVA
jgi:hypothetical protein